MLTREFTSSNQKSIAGTIAWHQEYQYCVILNGDEDYCTITYQDKDLSDFSFREKKVPTNELIVEM